MVSSASEEAGIGKFLEGVLKGQQMENGTPFTYLPYCISDDEDDDEYDDYEVDDEDDDGMKPLFLIFCQLSL